LGWADRQSEASAAYRTILRDDPGDTAAQRGLARMLSWRGRYRETLAVIDAMPEAARQMRDPAVIAAESLIWMGRPDRAAPLLQEQRARHPDDKHIAWLLDDLARKARPEMRLDGRLFDQSDGLAIDELSADLRVPFGFGRGHVGTRLSRARYRPEQGPVTRILVSRPLLYAGYRMSDAVEVSAAAALDIIDTRGAAGDFAKPTFEAYVTLRPSDRLRFDVGASRRTFDSEPTLTRGLTATQFGGSADFRADDHTVLSARANRATYSDGNASSWWQLEVSRRLVDSPRVIVSYRYTNINFRLPSQPGYYSPDAFHSHEAQLRSWGRILPRLRYDVRLVGGRETEKPGGSRWIINAGGSLTYEAGPRLEIEAGYDFSTSRTIGSGGFERGIARISLRKRF
ncbi:MAG: hypothetical protein HC788_01260, partial [Sphingopyxis sp.]|nr:hypothetical protein [Sphingopyxis sp.]